MEDRDALARHVRDRRAAAGLAIEEAASRGGMSPVTWARVEKAQPVRVLTYAGIERVLAWGPGSIRAILDGGLPTPMATDPDKQPTVRDPGGEDAAERLRMIDQLVKSADLDPATKIRLIGALLADEPAARS